MVPSRGARRSAKAGSARLIHTWVVMVPFVAVHVGAGNHADLTIGGLKSVCRTACEEAFKELKKGMAARSAVTTAVKILEDSPLTNAGLGSNLTLHGTVECDASVMDGENGFGAVGAVSGVRNPIEVAHALLLSHSKGLLPLRRIPPIMLCGEGARLWAEENALKLCDPDDLLTDDTRAIYLEHKSMLDQSLHLERDEDGPPEKKLKYLDYDKLTSARQDTVGAICLDETGMVAAACSSGGISLKYPGRVGQAGVYGGGCWAQVHPDASAVACSTSGIGEYLLRTMLAKEVCDSVSRESLSIQEAIQKKFTDSVHLKETEERLCGVILLQRGADGPVEFSWGHTTESMCVAYCSGPEPRTKVFLSRTDACSRERASLDLTAEHSSRTKITAGWMSVYS